MGNSRVYHGTGGGKIEANRVIHCMIYPVNANLSTGSVMWRVTFCSLPFDSATFN